MKHSKNKPTGKTAIIYARVSTDDQMETGFSLQEQSHRLRQHCQREGYVEIHEFREHCSAKNFNRPEFQRLLQMVKSKEIVADTLFITKIDRFSRETFETKKMVKDLSALGIKVFSLAEEDVDFTNPAKFLSLLIQAGVAEHENLMRSDNTRRGMRQANKEGRFTGKAPLGYLNNKLTKLLEIDPVNAPFIVKGFQEVAKGIYSVDEIRRRLQKEGMRPCGKQTFLNVVRNPLYCGKIKVPASKEEPEMLVRGLHEPLIDEHLYNDVQDVLNGRKKKFPSKITRNENLPLRGHLVCQKCGGNLTGSGSQSRTKDKHFYYHCQKGCKERFRADKANETFEQFLASFQIPDNVLALYHAILQDVFNQDDTERKLAISKTEREIEAVQKKKSSLDDKFLDDQIDSTDYNRIKQRIEEEEKQLIWKRTELDMEKSALKTYFDYGIPLLHNLKKYYSDASLEVKQKLVGSIFPEKLTFSEKKYRTTYTNELLTLLTSNINAFGSSEKEQADISVGLSSLAPRAGLEPATP